MRPLVLLFLLSPLALAAQQPARAPLGAPSVPASMMPPEGKCRIWIADVAPAQQPAPTDCRTALRQRPSNGRVIFGRATKERDPATFEAGPARVPPPAPRTPEPTKTPARDTAQAPVRPPARSPVRPRRPAEKSPERP